MWPALASMLRAPAGYAKDAGNLRRLQTVSNSDVLCDASQPFAHQNSHCRRQLGRDSRSSDSRTSSNCNYFHREFINSCFWCPQHHCCCSSSAEVEADRPQKDREREREERERESEGGREGGERDTERERLRERH